MRLLQQTDSALHCQGAEAKADVSRELAKQRKARRAAMQQPHSGGGGGAAAAEREVLDAAATASMFPELGRVLRLLPPLDGAAAPCRLQPLLLFPGESSVPLEELLRQEVRSSQGAHSCPHWLTHCRRATVPTNLRTRHSIALTEGAILGLAGRGGGRWQWQPDGAVC